jgi:PAS domain S-box-containing protein
VSTSLTLNKFSESPSGESLSHDPLFVVDERGTIIHANGATGKWWQTNAASLIGQYLPDLFLFEMESPDPADKAIQWDLLVTGALNNPVELKARISDQSERNTEIIFSESFGLGTKGYTVQLKDPSKVSPISSSQAPNESTPTSDDEKRWEPLIASSEVGLFDLNFVSEKIYYSAAWKTMLGYAEDELEDTHQTWLDLIHPEDSDATPDHSATREQAETTPYSIEFRMKHKTRGFIWVQSSGIQIFGETGQLERVIGVHLDIQERKELEEESLISEDRFLTFVNKTSRGFFDLDIESQTAFYSPVWLKQLGYGANDISHTPADFLDLLSPEERSSGLSELFSDPTDADSNTFSKNYSLKHNEDRYVQFSAQIIRITSRNGDLTRVIGLQVPFEEETDAGPHQQSITLETALNSSNEGVIITNSYGQILFINSKAEKLTGCESGTGQNSLIDDVLHCKYRSSGQRVDGLVEQVLSSREPMKMNRNFTLVSPNEETETEIVLACELVKDSKNRLFGVVITFRDPEEMNLTPEELIKCNGMESLGVLACGIAHDFNTLLTSILGSISVAKDSRDWDRLNESEKGCLGAKSLTRQLLTFAQCTSDGKKIQRLNETIQDRVSLASAGSGLQIEVDVPMDLNPVHVDAQQISQVIQNLIINAIQSTPEGGSVAIAAENIVLQDNEVKPLPAGEYIRIAVADNGIGIPSENIDHVFEPFFTTRETGTGLGLAMVKTIVDKHEGQVTIESTVDEGSIFTIYLPKAEHPVDEAGNPTLAIKFGTGRILIMDDEDNICQVASGMLQILEYESDFAHNGDEALALYRKYFNVNRPYDAVILDLTIVGGKGGYETLKKIREINPEAKVIVSSGYNSDLTEAEYLKKGFDAILSKPYRSADMGRVIKGVLGQS